MVSLKLAFTGSRPLICWWVIIFWQTTYLPNQCLPKLNYGITTRTLQSFFLRVVLPVLLKEKKTIHNSYIYKMEKQSFPPPITLQNEAFAQTDLHHSCIGCSLELLWAFLLLHITLSSLHGLLKELKQVHCQSIAMLKQVNF